MSLNSLASVQLNTFLKTGAFAGGGYKRFSGTQGAPNNEFVYLDRTKAQPGKVAKAEAQKEYWMWALAILAVLLAGETFLGQRFGHYSGGGRADGAKQETAVER